MFSTLLVANRGEIAVRVIRACRELGVRSVAVYSDADRGSPHVALADTAIRLGPAPPVESYLAIAALLRAAHEGGAEAIHPGYGFLAENAAFARAVREAGLTFVGPSPDAIARMGDKVAARQLAMELGIPVVPGSPHDADLESLAAGASAIGFPLLVKAAGGGGGRGMRRVESGAALAEALSSASREAQAALGDPRVYLERLIEGGRHIEVQVLADRHGRVIHLFERECSLQRRFQKIVEEAPAPRLEPGVRQALCEAAVRAARAVEYEGAGSVEFLVRGADWYFLEMNTRLQVEHPVTEMITGVDLVRAQIEIAAGAPLALEQGDIACRGHAIEARVCAEDPTRGFAPAPGLVRRFVPPGGAGVRCDAGVSSGVEVPPEYDSLIAKVIAHAADRPLALARLRRALRETVALGVKTNVAFLLALLEHPRVRAGDVDTQLVQHEVAALASGSRASPHEGGPDADPRVRAGGVVAEPLPPAVVAAALAVATRTGQTQPDAPPPGAGRAPLTTPWTVLESFRIAEHGAAVPAAPGKRR